MKVITETKMVPQEIRIYEAEDGTQFDNARKCETYEWELKDRKKEDLLSKLHECKALEDKPPFDGTSHDSDVYNVTFRWFYIGSKEDADILNQAFNPEFENFHFESPGFVCAEIFDNDVFFHRLFDMGEYAAMIYQETNKILEEVLKEKKGEQ